MFSVEFSSPWVDESPVWKEGLEIWAPMAAGDVQEDQFSENKNTWKTEG